MKKLPLLVFSCLIQIAWGQEKTPKKDEDSLKREVREKIIDPVIMVGYGTKKKIEVASAVSQIKGDIIKESPAANYTASLAGRLPGLVVNQRTSDPGQEDIEISIRGRGTFGDNSALIVVDGVVGRDGLARLDPQDIESVSVLKDASASVYGARAANGVILVTTKRGKTGKPLISFSTNTAISTPTRVVKGASPYNYAYQVNALRKRMGQSQLYSDGELKKFGSSDFKGIDLWNRLFSRESIQKRYSLSVRGGTNNVKYFVSLGLTNQDAIMKYDNVTDFSQYNVRSNVDFNVNKNLKLGLDLAGRLEKVKSPPYAFNAVDVASRSIPLNERYKINDKFLQLLNNGENPFIFINDQAGRISRENSLFNGTLRLNYDFPFLKGLSFNSWAAVDDTQNYVNTFNNNPVQYILQNDGTLVTMPLKLDRLVKDEYFRQRSLTFNMKLNFKRKFGAHNIDAFIAYEENQTKNNANSLSRSGGLISSSLPYLRQGDPSTQTTESAIGELARQAYISRISYDFSGRYLTAFGFRYDGSYIFPKGKRFGFFPYASAGWVVSKEKFLENSKDISLLKLRGSWGITGNDRVMPFQYLQRFQNPPQGGGIFYLTPDATNNSAIPLESSNLIILSPIGVDPNPNITWETSTSWDAGLELGLFSNALNLELDYFSAKRKDILSKRNVSIPHYTGLTPPDENIGKTKNQGFEATASYKTSIGDVNINIGGNIAFSKNKLIFNDSPIPEEGYQNLQGHPIGSILVYNAIGIYRNQADLGKYPYRTGTEIGDLIYADTNGDGQITTADRIVMDKTTTPTTQYGINLNITYKRFEFSSFWQGQSGSVLMLGSIFDEGVSTADYFLANAWAPNNPNALLPAIGGTKTTFNGYNNYENNFFTHNTSFIRLKNIQLAYNIPQNALNLVGVKSCRVFIGANNLLTFSKFNKLNFTDPEQTNPVGFERPLRKLYNIGFEINF